MSETNESVHPWTPLDADQRRVLGVLIEKAKTTPAGYPMTVNAIVTGCNQKNNREPLTSLDDIAVERALSVLITRKAVSEIDWMGRAAKYKHHAHEWFGVSRVELAVLAELLLRGEQTLGDLRARAARMEPIADLDALKPVVEALLARGLMVALTPPGRGQVVTHGVYLGPELEVLRARYAGHTGGGTAEPTYLLPPRPGSTFTPPAMPEPPADEIAELRAEIARLEARIAALEAKRTE